MEDGIRIIFADDHPTFRLGLKQMVSSNPGFTVVGEAGNGAEALELIRDLQPEIAVVDWNMPDIDGLALLGQVRREQLPTRIIILTMHNEERIVNRAVEAGVNGFVLKDHAVEDILECLEKVRSGRTFLSPAVAHHVLQRRVRQADLLQERPGLDQLTPTERRVMTGVSRGQSSKEIAAEMSISPRTVETHRRNICEKMGLHGSHSLMQFAMEHRDLL